MVAAAISGCSYSFDQIKADVPQLAVSSRYPLHAGFRVLDAATPMKLEEEVGPCWGADWPTPFAYGQVLKETAAGALGPLFETFEEARSDRTYDLVIEAKLERVGRKVPCPASKELYYVASGSLRALNQQGRRMWTSTKNEGRRTEAETENGDSHEASAKSISGALSLLVKGWGTELQASDLMPRLIARASQPGTDREPPPPGGAATTPSPPSAPGGASTEGHQPSPPAAVPPVAVASAAVPVSPPYRLPLPPEPGTDYPREARPSIDGPANGARDADLPAVAKTDSFMLVQRRGVFLRVGGGPSILHIGPIANAQATYPGFQGTGWNINWDIGGAIATGLVLAVECNFDLLPQSQYVQIAGSGSGRPLFAAVTSGLTWFPTRLLGLNLGARFGAGVFAADADSSTAKNSGNSSGYGSVVPWGEIQLGYDLNFTGDLSVGLQVYAGTGLGSVSAEKKLTIASTGLRLVFSALGMP
jgi:hypothetical protein